MSEKSLISRIIGANLVLQISVGIVAGIVVALISPETGKTMMLLGNLFVQALKAVAPWRRSCRCRSQHR